MARKLIPGSQNPGIPARLPIPRSWDFGIPILGFSGLKFAIKYCFLIPDHGYSTALWTTHRQTNSPTTKSPTDQLGNNPTRRQFNSPKLIYGRFGTCRNAVENMKVALSAG